MLANSQPLANELFTPTNIAGVAIATTAVNVATNALYQLAKLPQRWTAFIATSSCLCLVRRHGMSGSWHSSMRACYTAAHWEPIKWLTCRPHHEEADSRPRKDFLPRG